MWQSSESLVRGKQDLRNRQGFGDMSKTGNKKRNKRLILTGVERRGTFLTSLTCKLFVSIAPHVSMFHLPQREIFFS